MSCWDMYPVTPERGGGTTVGGGTRTLGYTVLTIDPLVRDLLLMSQTNSQRRCAGGGRGLGGQEVDSLAGDVPPRAPRDQGVLRGGAVPWHPWSRYRNPAKRGGGGGKMSPGVPHRHPEQHSENESGDGAPTGGVVQLGCPGGSEAMRAGAVERVGRVLTAGERETMCPSEGGLKVYVPDLSRPGPLEQVDEEFGEVSRAVGNWADITIRLTLALRNQAIRSCMLRGHTRRATHEALDDHERKALEQTWDQQAVGRSAIRAAEAQEKADQADAAWRARCSTTADPLAEWQNLLDATEFGSRAGRNEIRPCEEWIYTPCNGHGNGWAEAMCPCQCLREAGIDMPMPVWLKGIGADPHDSANCPEAGVLGARCGEAPNRTLASEHLHRLTGGSTGTAKGDRRRDRWRMERALDCESFASAEDDPRREQDLNWWRFHPRFRGAVRHGAQLPFNELPPPSCREGDPNYASASVPKVFEGMRELREAGIIQGPFRASELTNVIVVNPMGAVPKKNSVKLRIIVDFTASGCNERLPALPLFLPTVQDCLDMVRRPGTYAAKLDLRGAFFHTAYHPSVRPWCTIADPTPAAELEYDPDDDSGDPRRFWSYRTSNFGGKANPALFCNQIEHTVRWLRDSWGLDCLMFVDDLIILNSSKARVVAGIRAARACFEFLGYVEEPSKYEAPSQVFEWLGLQVDARSGEMVVRLPLLKRERLIEEIDAFRTAYDCAGARAPRKELASLVGRIAFAAHGVRGGRIYTRRLYQALHRHTSHLTIHQRVHMGGVTRLDRDFWGDLAFWSETLPTAQGVKFFCDSSTRYHKIFGDASAAGRGATYYSSSGPVSFSWPWEEEMQNASSNLRELTTFLDALRLWSQHFARGDRVMYTTDNLCTSTCINRGSGSSEQLLRTTRMIHTIAAEADVHVMARWAPGTALIKEGADGLSRAEAFAPRDQTEWRVPVSLGAHWLHVHGDVLQMPRFSQVGKALSQAVAAFTDTGKTASFIVPEWPSAAWYPLLKRFRLDAAYARGAKVITHEGLLEGVPSRHPMVVIRLAGALEPGLSGAQRRAAGRCLDARWTTTTGDNATRDAQARRAGRARASMVTGRQ